MLRQIPAILLIVFMTCACSGSEHSSELTAARRFEAPLKQMVAETLAQYRAPGAVVSIRFNDNSLFVHADGYADTDKKTRLTPDHYFRIGSATKTFTSMAILLLCQQGLLDLNDSVETLLPGLVPGFGDAITLRMLLNHTSGLSDYVAAPYGDTHFYYVYVGNPVRDWTAEELVKLSVDEGLESAPGVKFAYSNTNYILLGLIIEKFSKHSYAEFVRENFANKLGLEDTFVPLTCEVPAPAAHGYYDKNGDGRLYDFTRQSPTGVWAAGNMVSKVSDLMIWLDVLVKGKLLNEDLGRQQFDFLKMDNSEADGYGLGVCKMKGAVGHNGSVLGYQTQMFAIRDTYFVVYTNCYYQGDFNVSQILMERARDIVFPDPKSKSFNGGT